MPTDEQANFARIKGGATKLPDLRIFRSLQIGARPAALTGALRFTFLLELLQVFFAQFRTQNRCALLLELLWVLFTQFRTQNRCALLLELL